MKMITNYIGILFPCSAINHRILHMNEVLDFDWFSQNILTYETRMLVWERKTTDWAPLGYFALRDVSWLYVAGSAGG